MIEQVLEIRQLGRFHETGPAIAFDALTLIQGANGSGKTTLAAIFRSLAKNAPHYLLERQTLGTAGSPFVRVQIDGEIYTFSEGQWDKPGPDIAVFDSTFVNENVHSGFLLTPDHRRRLFDFILGEKPVETAREILELDARSRELQKQIKSFDQRPYLLGQISMELFSGLEIDPDLNDKRQRLLHRLDLIERREPIVEAPLLRAAPAPSLPLQALEDLLTTGFENIQANAQEQVQAWLQQLGPGSERWLAEGARHLQHLESQHCPFCSQPVSQMELVQAYGTYFNQAYQAHQQTLNQLESELAQAIPKALLQSWQHLTSANQQAYRHWSRYLTLPVGPELKAEALWQQMTDFVNRLRDLLVQKRARPMEPLALEQPLQTAWHAILRPLLTYRQAAASVNQAIEAYRQGSQEEDPEPLRRQLAKLELQRQRQQPDVQADLAQWQALQAQKAELAASKEMLRTRLEQESTALFSRSKTRLNKHLFRFGTGLSVGELKETHQGGKPNLDYGLRHQRGEIRLTAPKSPRPSWSTVLSEGDKQVLGLAFFLARQEEQPARIIVLDDPGVGLDRSRLQILQKWIEAEIGQQRQVMVLTHQDEWGEQWGGKLVRL